MYARHVTYRAKPGSAEAITAMVVALLPELRRQPGFIEMLMLTDDTTGEYVGVSRWETDEDAERVTTSILPRLIDGLGAVLHEPPVVRIYRVFEPDA